MVRQVAEGAEGVCAVVYSVGALEADVMEEEQQGGGMGGGGEGGGGSGGGG